jgi:hypothetical protein
LNSRSFDGPKGLGILRKNQQMFCGCKKARLTRKRSLNKQKIAERRHRRERQGQISRKGAKRNLAQRRQQAKVKRDSLKNALDLVLELWDACPTHSSFRFRFK